MRNLTLAVKLVGGFILVAIITLIIGLVGWGSSSRLGAHLEKVGGAALPAIENLLIFREAGESIRVAQRTLLIPNLDQDTRKRQYDNVANARERYQNAMKSYEALPRSSEEEALWKQFLAAWEAFKAENEKFFQLSKDVETTSVLDPTGLVRDLEHFRGDHFNLVNKVSRLILTKEGFEGGEDAAQCPFGKWVSGFKGNSPKINDALKGIIPLHDSFHQTVKKVKALAANGEWESALDVYTRELTPASEAIFKHFGALAEEAGKAEAFYAKMKEQAMVATFTKQKEALPLLSKLIEINQDRAAQVGKAAVEDTKYARWIAIVGMVVNVIVALALGLLLNFSVTGPIHNIISGLTDGAEQVSAASAQVASASRQLAEGASQQAAAIEETSSALEEMSAMTRQNADNSRQANSSMVDTSQVVNEAKISMTELTSSMEEISKASEETSKIIKTIDEIAFQTNLLALNAAVEAARAGEAGAGFAVVADEVRNLAMRAAEAAKNTAHLIEGTVKKIKNGSEIVSKASTAFEKVADGARRVGDLIGEITAASGEQAEGIEQLNKAVSDMDRVIQQNAATAEESAAASGQMHGQARQMKVFVKELIGLVDGAKAGEQIYAEDVSPRTSRQAGSSRSASQPAVRRPALSRTAQNKAAPTGAAGKSLAVYREGGKEVPPEKVIPFDDDDFKDF